MSKYEARQGKLRLFPRIDGESDEAYILRFIEENGKVIPGGYDPLNIDDLLDLFSDVFYRTAILVEGNVYEVYDHRHIDERDMFKATKLENGDIEFWVQYYNGGCSFNEAIRLAIKSISEKEQP